MQLSRRYKRGLVLLGGPAPARVALMVMMAMVGREATSGLSVEHMDDATMRAVIVGKKLNLLTELPVNAVVKDSAKQLVSTEEPIMINEKNAGLCTSPSASTSSPPFPAGRTDRSRRCSNRPIIRSTASCRATSSAAACSNC
jgi:hypothetical protein